MLLFNRHFGEDPDDHVMRFQRYCLVTSKGGPEQFPRRFQGLLAGCTEGWYNALDAKDRADWDRLSRAFLARFRSPRFRLECQEKLHSIRQLPDECLNAYSDRVRRLVRLFNMTNVVQMHEIKMIWLKGLCRDLFTVELIAEGQNFEECVWLAEDHESRNSNVTGNTDHSDLVCQLQELRCDMAKMSMQRRSDDSSSGGYRPHCFRSQQPVNTCKAEEEEDT